MTNTIDAKLRSYKSKRYLLLTVRGALLSLTIFMSALLILSVLEGSFWFQPAIRLAFLLGLVALFAFLFTIYVGLPFYKTLNTSQGISNEKAAEELLLLFPEMKDKLINYLQLDSQSENGNSLLAAAIDEKTKELKVFDFSSSLDFKVNLKYAYAFVAFLVIGGIMSFINPALINENPSRIVNFSKEFTRPAPFKFKFLGADYQGFKGESLDILVSVEGDYIPPEMTIQYGSQKGKFQKISNDQFKYTFSLLSNSFSFTTTAAGFTSEEQSVKVYARPELRNFEVKVKYPEYTGRTSGAITNNGSFLIPEGSEVEWQLLTKNTVTGLFKTETDSVTVTPTKDVLKFERLISENIEYEFTLHNDYGENKNRINYRIDVIKDQYPEVTARYLADTVLKQNFLVSIEISDDYGFSKLELIATDLANQKIARMPLELRKGSRQALVHSLSATDLGFENSEDVEVYVEVTDNDGFNGPKSAKSSSFYFSIPKEDEIQKALDKRNQATQSTFEKNKNKAESLNEKLEKVEERLKSKNEIGWQEEKMINDLLEERKKIEEDLEKLKQEHQGLIQLKDQFEKPSPDLQQKSKELQKLIEELLDEETKKLYDELQRLLEEEASSEEVQNKLSEIKNNEKNLEDELERTLELFKRFKMESELQKLSKDLEELGQKQKELGERNSENMEEDVRMEQKEIKENFDGLMDDLEQIEKLNQDLKRPEPLNDLNEDGEEIREKLEEIQEQMDQENGDSPKQKQRNVGDKMQQLSQQMQQMQGGMEMEMMQENMDDLQNIVDNLVKLSFEEERILTAFSGVSQTDPRFLELSQDQLTLINNTEVVKDSLQTLASRVVQISNFITREIGLINEHLDQAMEELRERNKGKATSHQQYAMTSMNNLALLLGDVLEQMQMAMSEAMGKPKKGEQQQSNLPDMSELQQQLSEQIQELKKSGKAGRQLSEELARLAAEQAMLREEMRKLQETLDGQPENQGPSKSLKEIMEKMEQNEVDLVNKRLTDNLIKRQKEILTKMLEAEKAVRKQDESQEREGETSKNEYENLSPAFQDYLKAKKAEVEMFKTIPLDLSPFYKKEVNDYFRRLSTQDN